MKFFHLSDLHIGKCLNGYSLKENQEEVFRQIVEAARQYRPDAILICGDVYDKSVPLLSKKNPAAADSQWEKI